MNFKPYSVYVHTDDTGRITDINSSAFLPSPDGWTKIDEGFGDKYHHAQSHYFPDSLWDERGIYRYKVVDGAAVERTQEEMDGDYTPPTIEPTEEEDLSAMVIDHEYRLTLMELGLV